MAASISGRIYTVRLDETYEVSEISIPGDLNSPDRPHAWFVQAERWLIVQDMLDQAFLYDGTTARRALDGEVPIGGPMAYGKGRLAVARDNLFFVGDLVWSDQTLGRDTVIRFLENTFLAGGGAWAVGGKITGMAYAANLDTSLGDGDLDVATSDDIQAFSVPVDRTVWTNLEYPPLRYAMRHFGALNHETMVPVNGDIFFRSLDGIRSLAYARRDFGGEWGNTPISRQVSRALDYDTEELLYAASGINFDNRMLMTAMPVLDPAHGVWHHAIVPLDFHMVGGMGIKVPPCWEGIWTGLKFLQIVSIHIDGKKRRAFAFCLGSDSRLELWELSKGDGFDFNSCDDVPIAWAFETRSFAFGNPRESKHLTGSRFWPKEMAGEITARARYRTDGSLCWHEWGTIRDCAKYRNCQDPSEPCGTGIYPSGNAVPVRHYRRQIRAPVVFPEPPEVFSRETNTPTRVGFEFQARFDLTGKIRIRRLELIAARYSEPLNGTLRNYTCPPDELSGCIEDCGGVECCDADDLTYQIQIGDCVDETGGYPDYPNYPDYPDYPEPPPPETPTPPVYDPLHPSDPPTLISPCAPENQYLFDSNYVWGLDGVQDPNSALTPEQIACNMALFAIEIEDTIELYTAMGYSVSIVSGLKWVFFVPESIRYAMILKPTCNPDDGIGDHQILFGGYTSMAQILCLVPPST